jgi:hypothetical protein
MPRKKDTSSAQLRTHIELETNPLARALGLVNDSELLGSAYTAATKYAVSDWSNTEARSIAAHHALSIDERDIPLKRAFAAFCLDDRNPFHWRKLISYFAKVHFDSKHTRPGPPQVWTDDRLCTLLRDFNWQKGSYRPPHGPGFKVQELKICELMKVAPRFAGRYDNFTAETILRNLQRARDPKINKILGKVVSEIAEPIIAELRLGLQKKGAKLDQEATKKLRSIALAVAITTLSRQDERDPKVQ